MSSTSHSYINTARTLASISQQRATGELTLTQNEHSWRLYFFQGRLVYATGTLHRVRRWQRAIKQHCSGVAIPSVVNGEPWEYELLSQSVAQSHVNVAQAQGVIKMSLEEVLFSWISDLTLRSDWSSSQRFSFKSNAALSLLLSSTQIEAVLKQSQKLWKHWKLLELESLNPSLSPVLQQAFQAEVESLSPALARLNPFLTGRHTLWDIACHARRPVTIVTQFLLPWVQRGAISLEEVADLPTPIRQPPVSSVPATAQYRPLIACIDDSPTVNQFLANILEPAGYRVLKIQDPLAGMAALSKHKPDLIVMDLVMPTASGYDVCTFLRKTPIFQNTPIIILTSQSGLVDRTRAKLAGASDFLSKPPDPQTLLSLVRTHLQSVMPPASSVTCQCWEE
ncbi:MAG: response regulator [Oscillatoriales cyanobacterium C42_A2020_001]|nr:response regulator [Leptolyngbyaceae cyanobacterium C42_A2020_001]